MQHGRTLRRRLIESAAYAIFALGAAGAGQAQAQTQDVEEVIVTATKRDQALQSVPASVSALSGEALEARKVETIEALSHVAPNLAYTVSAGVAPNFSIRGVSPDGVSPTMEGTVALHIDGIFQPRVSTLSLAMSDLAGVEVLRGPQGTLYGRNANAGVINLNTRKPTPQFEASVTGTIGSHGLYGARGYVSGPITDQVLFRLAAMGERRSGYGRNLSNGHRVDGYEQWGARASLRLLPTENLEVDLAASHTDAVNDAPFYIGNAFGTQAGSNYNLLVGSGRDSRYSLEPHRVYNTFDPKASSTQTAFSGIAAWSVSDEITIRSITGFQEFDLTGFQDQDGTPSDWIVARPGVKSQTFSQEFNANLRIADRADIVLGLYYLDDDLKGGNVVNIPLGNPVGNAAAAGLLLTNTLRQNSKSLAAFADVSFSVTDRFRLLGGLRQTRDERNTVQGITTGIRGSFTSPGTVIGGCTLNNVVPDITFDSTTGKAGVQYDLAEDVMAYVSWQNGFKAGGWSSSVCNNQFKPEKVEAWEGGLKGRYLDGRLTLNLAAFDYDYTNMQLSRTFSPTPTTHTTIIDNAASSRVYGGEIEAFAELSDAWTANLAIGVVKSRYGELEARNGAVPGNPNFVLTGNRLPRAPTLTVNAGLEYVTPLAGAGELTLRLDYNYTSKIYFTPFNEAIAVQDGYGLVDVFATFRPEGRRLAFRAYGKNLTDERYFTGLFTSSISNNGRGTYGAPRTWGLEVTADF